MTASTSRPWRSHRKLSLFVSVSAPMAPTYSSGAASQRSARFDRIIGPLSGGERRSDIAILRDLHDASSRAPSPVGVGCYTPWSYFDHPTSPPLIDHSDWRIVMS